MNRGLAENQFRAGLEELLEGIAREQQQGAVNPYAGAGDQKFHEHDTRVVFFDRLLKLLGWELGGGGNVAEEARIKADTTKFVDYVGLNDDTRAPALIFEAKAWGKPIVTGKSSEVEKGKAALIAKAIKHVNAGGSREEAPVSGDWHDYLGQLGGYVRDFKEQHGHDVPSAVLSSGQWLLIFDNPVATFCDDAVNDSDFLLLELQDYVPQAHLIYQKLARVMLADTAPFKISSAQLGNYITLANLKEVYHGLLIRYEKSGSPLIGQHPRILLYPALLFERDDRAIFTVIDASTPITVRLMRQADGTETLTPHIGEVAEAAQELLNSCSTELGVAIVTSQLSAFPGFPDTSVVASKGLELGTPQKIYVRPTRTASDNWLAVTGHFPHYLLAEPIMACRFHSWSECHAVHRAIGGNAVGSPTVDGLRAFFVDNKPHHCAHSTLDNRRENRCHIRPIDSRMCCKACCYQDLCWTAQDAANLPCGT